MFEGLFSFQKLNYQSDGNKEKQYWAKLMFGPVWLIVRWQHGIHTDSLTANVQANTSLEQTRAQEILESLTAVQKHPTKCRNMSFVFID